MKMFYTFGIYMSIALWTMHTSQLFTAQQHRPPTTSPKPLLRWVKKHKALSTPPPSRSPAPGESENVDYYRALCLEQFQHSDRYDTQMTAIRLGELIQKDSQ